MLTDYERFIASLRHVQHIEGGYSNDSRDRGGATNHGISHAFARALSIKSAYWRTVLDVDGDGRVTEADMRRLPLSVAESIYYNEFWKRHRCGEIPFPASLLYFSYVVNMKATAAVRILQTAISRSGGGSITVDGVIGPKTIAAARRCDVPTLCKRLEAAASEHYADLGDTQPYYEAGWQYRSADALWAAALLWAQMA